MCGCWKCCLACRCSSGREYIHGLSPILLGCPPSLQTSMKVEEGVRQLEKAEKKQKQSGMVLCIMLLLVAIVVMVLLVIFKAIFL
jgi:predicted nucleic acid-binding Zn ribbon protein